MNRKSYETPELEIIDLSSVNVLTLSEWDNTEGGDASELFPQQ